MGNLIDKKTFVTGVLILVAAFFLKRWFTKSRKNADGTTSTFVGFDGFGYM
ncbi:hypothetical protein [Nubsella zeaxanthinifaciens]|uniref:hypothetical protein n=1 Tax=Nubsella zeaxanthinifaciens TaxID=392412 RepID=UPI001300329D|nr:hypothetical protein [Nubsella zeaxanthinifaciens]